MAWIKTFEGRDGSGKRQPTDVVGLVKTFTLPDGGMVLQIDTLGSKIREKPGKQSQTIQLGSEAARELFDILGRTFQFK